MMKMSTPVDPLLRELDDCACCEGTTAQTPARVANRPGLSALAYRSGTHAQYLQTLVARLSNSAYPALRALTTRDADDFSIALLDAWATVADVLSFYNERIANESYLATATERMSLLELARLIGYELRPGVAASTHLAFTLDEVPGASRQLQESLGVPIETTIPVGVKVQSLPAPGERAQTFETIAATRARVEWNRLKPRLTRRHTIAANADVLYFAGLATNLRKGDALLVTPSSNQETVFRQIVEVTNEDARGRTRVRLEPRAAGAASAGITATLTPQTTPALSPVTQKYLNQTILAADLEAAAQVENFKVRDLFDNLAANRKPAPRLIALRTRAGIFGHNAPAFAALSASQRIGEYAPKPGASESPTPPLVFTSGAYSSRAASWAEQSLNNYPGNETNSKNIFLDAVYPNIVRGSYVALVDAEDAKAYRVERVVEMSKADFTLSAKVTRLTFDRNTNFNSFNIRTTTVFAQSEELDLARLPIEESIAGECIELETWVENLTNGQSIIICGELAGAGGTSACELATIGKVEQVLETEGFTRITLNTPLKNAYVRESVTINANIAPATHGETVAEILGSGNGNKAYQSFTLRQPPLTYTSSAAPSGIQTTLEIRVNDLLWREVSSFYAHAPDERIYITRTDDAGTTTVHFGDGRTGARLPTGQENVHAIYRKGTGTAGLVKANQLSQLMTRPLGVKAAVNPLVASGAADPETRDAARRNAPLTILTLERAVSLRDYEDFASAFGGIGKALATWTWTGERRGVLLTVAGIGGAAIADNSPLHTNLLSALRASGDPHVSLTIKPHAARLFRLAAKVKIHADYLAEKLLPEIETELRRAFAFDARAFGQPVSLSEVVAVMHRVAGVVAVDVDELYFAPDAPALNAHLPAAAPRPGAREMFAAELLTLDPSPLNLKVMP